MRYLPDNKVRFEWMGIPRWHAAGYLGQGMKFLVVDADTDLGVVRYPDKVHAFKESGKANWRYNYGYHGLMTIDILQQICPEAEIYFVGKQYSLTDAIRWGISNGVDIATVSLGYNWQCISATVSQQAIDSGMLLLTSAGNEGDLPEDLKGYPGKMKTWVAVGAAMVQADGTVERLSYSATGPGLEVMGMSHLFVDFPDLSQPYVYTGTSCASPSLAGCLALMEQKMGDLTKEQVREMFTRYCVDMDEPGRDDKTGWGLFKMPDPYSHLPGKKIRLQIDNLNATVDGVGFNLDAPPMIVNSRTMVPLSFIARQLGHHVEWIEATREIVITEGGKPDDAVAY